MGSYRDVPGCNGALHFRAARSSSASALRSRSAGVPASNAGRLRAVIGGSQYRDDNTVK
jgi:hypothetical protein